MQNREEELVRLREELTTLRQEEQALELKVEVGKAQLDHLDKTITDTNSQMNQVYM